MSNRDGGPAFSRPISTDEAQEPCNVAYDQPGMTMRQYYKAMAMQGMLSGPDAPRLDGLLAQQAGAVADAMLAEDREHEERGT